MAVLTRKWRLSTVGFALALAMGVHASPMAAAGPQVHGSGGLRTAGMSADFVVQLDDSTPATFAYWDTSYDPVRVVSLGEAAGIDCLGDLFGGQTVRVTGSGSDSTLPGEVVFFQIFLVDGREAGGDRLSVTVSRMDGARLYFRGLQYLESGDISVSCSS